MIWTILGIAETKDKKEITRAYRDKLSGVNPEEMPDEFRELREAYEEALRLADTEDKPDAEKTELELWTDELDALYADLVRRTDTGSWKELLSRDVCTALDTRPQAEEALLRYFMSNFRIPHEVMVCLNDEFGFTDHMDELKEKFPQDFLEYIIVNVLRYEDSFPMKLFVPGTDGRAADRYTDIYRKASVTAPEDAKDLYRQMEESTEKHPYGEALLLSVRLADGDMSALDELKDISNRYPEDDHLALDLILGYKTAGRMDLAEELADECLKRNPDLNGAKRFKAEAAAAREDYQTAVDIVSRLMSQATGDSSLYAELADLQHSWNDKLISKLSEVVETDPSDSKSRFDLIWCLIQNGRHEEADVLAQDLPEGVPEPFGWYNVKSVLAENAHRYEEALEHTRRLLDTVDSLVPDGTERTSERIARRTEIVGRISAILYNLGRREEAVDMAEQTLRDPKADIGSMFNLITMHIRMKNFTRAVETADIILEREPGNALVYYYKAFAAFSMRNDNLAFQSVNDSLERDGSNLQPYLLKLRILVRNDAFEAAEELIGFLEQNGITSEPTLDYCRILMFYRKNEPDRTKEDYDRVLKDAADLDAKLGSEGFGSPDWAADFYYVYANITAGRQDFDKEYPVDPIIELLNIGLSYDSEHYSCLSYKGWLLRKNKQNKDALEIFKNLEKRPDHASSVEENLALLYYADLIEHAGEALHYNQFLLENDPGNGDLCFYVGMCLNRLERPSEAEEYFLREQENDPDAVDGYFRLAYALLKQDRLEEAVIQAQKAVDMVRDWNENTVRFWTPLINAYRRLGRPADAIEAVRDCAEHNKEWDTDELIFEIYLQEGMMKEAERLVRKWRRKLNKNKFLPTALVKLSMVGGKKRYLGKKIRRYSYTMKPADVFNAESLLAAMKGSPEEYMKAAEKYCGVLKKDGELTSYERGNYAWALFVGGSIEKARLEAEAALEGELRDEELATGMRMMHAARKVRLLSILGREDEAEDAVKAAEALPFCESCECRGCKDLAIFVCSKEYAFGNLDRAMEIALEGEKNWPDETDFIEFEYLIKAKRR